MHGGRAGPGGGVQVNVLSGTQTSDGVRDVKVPTVANFTWLTACNLPACVRQRKDKTTNPDREDVFIKAKGFSVSPLYFGFY